MTYPYTLFFTKLFNNGFLVDLELEESLPVVSKEYAEGWIDGVNENKELLGYEITNYSIV